MGIAPVLINPLDHLKYVKEGLFVKICIIRDPMINVDLIPIHVARLGLHNIAVHFATLRQYVARQAERTRWVQKQKVSEELVTGSEASLQAKDPPSSPSATFDAAPIVLQGHGVLSDQACSEASLQAKDPLDSLPPDPVTTNNWVANTFAPGVAADSGNAFAALAGLASASLDDVSFPPLRADVRRRSEQVGKKVPSPPRR
ncbi:hypothetical protein LINGRAHAP2_LOCUS23065 [Linum grandiflorum]